MKIKKTFLYLTIIFVLVFLNNIKTIDAMTVTPVRYEIKGNPGETLVEEMMIMNEDPVPVTYYSSFANFEAQGETGSASFVEPVDDIGTWIETEKSVSLTPGEQRSVGYSIKIPENAEPGGHFGVIFWGTSPGVGENGEQLSVSAQTGILILLSVSGDVKEEAGLLDFLKKDNKFWYNSLPVTFTYRFKNDGGDRIKPVGFIRISNTLFIPTKKIDANPVNGNILPASTRKFVVDWVKYTEPKNTVAPTGAIKNFFHKAYYQWRNFAVGLYSAKLDITYGLQEKNVNKTVFFFVFPWQMLICLIIILIIIFFAGKTLLVKYNRYIIKQAHSSIVKKLEDADHA